MLIYGHRGASADFPENTIPAFEGSVAQGADGIEFDVRRSFDGALVIHHDANLGDGRAIAEVSAAELDSHIPTFDEALDACGPLIVNVEIKHDPREAGFSEDRRLADQVLEAWHSRSHSQRIIVSSFDVGIIDRIRVLDPSVPTGFLAMSASDPIDAVARCLDGGHSAIHPWDPLVDQPLVDRCHEADLAVNVWTVDDPGRFILLASWGVDGVVTNRPGLARRTIG